MIKISSQRDGESVSIDIETFKFPAGEIHYKLSRMTNPLIDDEIEIVADIESSDDVLVLAFLAETLRAWDPSIAIILQLVYLPYARQDRRTEPTEPFSLKVFSKILNMCEFDRVYLHDPHSDVAPALINNSWVRTRDFKISPKLLANSIIVSPDVGAQKSNNEIAKNYGIQHVIATKERDVKTGEISATKVHTDLDLKGKKLVVCDDLCDGGRTFIELAKVLRKYEPASIHLYITYGIFSKGIEVLDEHFDSVNYAYSRNQHEI